MITRFFSNKSSAKTEETPATSEEKENNASSSWLSRLKHGLQKSAAHISTGITDLVTKRTLDEAALEELEELLIAADLGVSTAAHLRQVIARTRFGKEVSAEEIKQVLAEEIAAILTPVAKPLAIQATPEVMVVVGVNGNGKTTTIGKLAQHYKAQGTTVLLAACDTFRAAAVEQLAIWAARTDTPLIQGEPESDPASVAYKAFMAGKEKGTDIVLIDTAGRLHNKTNLMQELTKIIRVLKKIDPEAPHQVLLVLDATTGQNAFKQVESFKQMIGVTGLIITKLDGTAKGGVVVGLAKHYGLPIHAVGVGEAVEDLQPFDPLLFACHLVGIESLKNNERT